MARQGPLCPAYGRPYAPFQGLNAPRPVVSHWKLPQFSLPQGLGVGQGQRKQPFRARIGQTVLQRQDEYGALDAHSQ